MEVPTIQWRKNALTFAGLGLVATGGTIGAVMNIPSDSAAFAPTVALGAAAAGSCFTLATTMLQPDPKPDPENELAEPLRRAQDQNERLVNRLLDEK